MLTDLPLYTKRLLIAGLLAVPMSLTAGDVLAKSCHNGGCGGPSNLEKAIAKIESSASTVASGNLDTAYDSVMDAAQNAEQLNIDSNRKVRAGLRELAQKLEQRTNAELKSAIDRYFEGYHAESLATFEEIAKLTGLPSARLAEREVDKEADRHAWRTANETAAKLIDSKAYGQAREHVSEIQRLARRTNYDKQTSAAMTSFAKQMIPDVEAGEKLIGQSQYLDAYTKLIEIARITSARESSSAARRVLGQNASLDGMRQAKGEYEAADALSEAKTWYSSLTNPTNQEQRQYQQTLESIANNYKGTIAGDEAQRLLVSDDAQAAR